MTSLRYVLDEHNVIQSVDRDWDMFADSNGAPELFGTDVIGHNIFDFITDHQTVSLYKDIYQVVREKGIPLDFTFRCDSPNLKRLFMMKIGPHSSGWIEVETQLLEQEEVEDGPIDIACSEAPLSIPRCSICGRIEWQGRLLSPADALREGLTLAQGSALQVYYMICAECQQKLAHKKQAIHKAPKRSAPVKPSAQES